MEEKMQAKHLNSGRKSGETEQKPMIFRVLCVRVGVGGERACLVRTHAGLCVLRGVGWLRQGGGAGERRWQKSVAWASLFDPLKCMTGKCVMRELAGGTDAPLNVAVFLFDQSLAMFLV